MLIGYEMNYIDIHMETLHPYLFPQKKEWVNCENMAKFMHEIAKALLLCHILSAFVLLFREIRETSVGTFGKIMKGLEVLGMGLFILGIVKCLHVMSIFQYYEYLYWKFPEY